jgi:transglutaminase superfamily protein
MARLAKLRGLSAAEWRILATAWLLLLVAPLLLRVLPLRRLLGPPRRRRVPRLPPERVARLVDIAARRVPSAPCLSVAIVTARLLARQGTAATLRIGVARRDERLAAHAWLECGGAPLLDGVGDYTPILAVAVVPP